MAIQMRRGNKADFDPTKMLPGEWAVSIDSDTTKQWVWMCFAPGVVKRMAAFEDIEWVLSDEFAKSAVICDVELDSTATQDYAVGDFLMLHGHLYEVTVAITTGDTIEEGTNVTETKVMDTIAGKVDKETGKGLSTNDYTDTEKAALAQAQADIVTLNADLANKADDSVVVKSVNTKTPTNGAVEVTAEDIPADGIGDKSVSGNPIVIEDGMASVAKELSVTLEPIQDLHGYESPWIGTDTDKQPYLFRAISESSVQDKGTHELDKLIGGTVAWNQQCKRNSTTSDRGLTITDNADGSITVNGTAVSRGPVSSFIAFPSIANHVYLLFSTQSKPTTWHCIYTTIPSSIAFTGAFISRETTSKAEAVVTLRTDADAVWDNIRITLNCFDLTQMFGSTIADYIYSLEQATAGAGVSFFRKLFPAPYYPFDSGTLMSVKTSAHVMRGFNQWDEEWEVGGISTISGEPTSTTANIRSKNFNVCIGGQTYYGYAVNRQVIALFYDSNQQYIGYKLVTDTPSKTCVAPDNAKYFKLRMSEGTAYSNDICFNISDPSKNGTYEPYTEHSYPLDSDLELRGIPKLDSNNKLYYDGDIYEASGNVQRKYGVVDLGTLTWALHSTYANTFTASVSDIKSVSTTSDIGNVICQKYMRTSRYSQINSEIDKSVALNTTGGVVIIDTSYTDSATFKAAMSGVYLVYELATPTTETADPYTSTQVIDPDGTEEYVDSRTVAIPVGHESNYANICPIDGRTGTEVQRTGKNLLPLTVDEIKTLNTSAVWSGNSYTVYGITFTLNAGPDGYVTGISVNGTATNATGMVLFSDMMHSCPFIGDTLSGCPEGGSNTTYDLRISDIYATSSSDTGSGTLRRDRSNTGM